MSAKPLTPTNINEIPFPGSTQEVGSGGRSDSQDVYYPTNITPVSLPNFNVAYRVKSNSLDTENRTITSGFTFTQYGAISIGNYKGGTGVLISPNGIVGKKAGTATFTLNAITGDATFGGTLTAGVVVAVGALVVGTNVGLGTAQDAGGVTTIVGNTVTTGYVNALNVTANSVSAGWVYANTLTAGQVNAVAINADSITTGTLTGRTVQSSTGNEKIVLDNGNYIRFYAGGNLKASIRGTSAGSGGVQNDGDFFVANNRSYLIASTSGGGNEYGGIGVTNGNQLWLTCGTSDQLYVKNNAQNVNFFTTSNSETFSEKHFHSNENYMVFIDKSLHVYREAAIDFTGGRGGKLDIADGSNHYILEIGGGGAFWINGNSKSAIVPTKTGFNALYCMESPEVWFMDFTGEDKKTDPMFDEVTEGKTHWVKTEDGYQVWRQRRGHAEHRFDPKTYEQFEENEKFLSIPHQKD